MKECVNGLDIKKSQKSSLACLFFHLLKPVITGFIIVMMPNAVAGPVGGNVIAGHAEINHSGLNTTINQSSNRVAIDWQSFNINADESVRFNQPDLSSIALNRILDQDPSQIMGSISANGQVVLVNPNGIFFSETASVNVGGLFASALDISPDDFMAGRLDFKALANTSGLIINQGTLQVVDGGTLALIGQQVRNEGLLVANFGAVALASGSDIQISFDEYEQLSIKINQNRLADALGIDDPAIFNSGLIQAHGGRVVLTARQVEAIQNSIYDVDETDRFSAENGMVIEADGGYYLTGPDGDISDLGHIDVSTEAGNGGTVIYAGGNVTHQGQVNADSQQGDGGLVLLDASDTTLLTDNSAISAQSHDEGRGGQVYLLGEQVGLIDQAQVNASGAQGGGEVLVGGDYLGENPNIKNARAVYAGENTEIHADAVDSGDGGKIILWSNEIARAYGGLSATGGEWSGNGGFIETSSRGYVDLAPVVDVHASNGGHGEWLIDPSYIEISGDGDNAIFISASGSSRDIFSTSNDSALSVGRLQGALDLGANVTVRTQVHQTTINTPVGCDNISVICTGTQTGEHHPESRLISTLTANGIAYNNTYHYGDIILFSNLDYDNAGINRNAGDNASSLTLQAHRDVVINGNILDSDLDNINPTTFVFSPDGDILDLTLTANYQGAGVQAGDPSQGSVIINGNIDLQGGDFTASGVDFIQGGSITTALPGLSSNSGFDPVAEFGANPALPGGDVDIQMTRNITLNRITTDATSGNLNVFTSGGSIAAPAQLTVEGTTTLAATGNVSLTSASNRLVGDVVVNNGAAVDVRERGDLNILLNATVASMAMSTFNSGSATLTSLNSATLSLGTSSVAGSLIVDAAGSVDQVGVINVQGSSQFNLAPGSDVTLTGGNRFNGAVSVGVNTASLTDRIHDVSISTGTGNSLELADVQINGSLSLDSGNNLVINNVTLDDDTENLSLVAFTSLRQNTGATTGITRDGTGTNTLTATTGDISLRDINAHNFNTVDAQAGGQIQINNGGNGIVLNTTNTASVLLDAGSAQIVADSDVAIAGSVSSLTIDADGDISNIADQGISVSGTTQLTLTNGGGIDLDNGFSGGNVNDLQGVVTLTSGTGSIDAVALNNQSDIQLAGLTVAGGLDLTSQGNINQTGAWINTNGDARLHANDITLGQTNDFNSLVIEDSQIVNITEQDTIAIIGSDTNADNSIDLRLSAGSDVVLSGEFNALDVTATGDIADAAGAALIVANVAQLNAGSNDIILRNGRVDLDALMIHNANHVDILNADALQLSGHAVSIDVLTRAGDITNGATGLTVDANSTFNAASGSANVSLLRDDNDFGQVELTAANAELHDGNGITLGNINNLNNLTINAQGDINQQAGTSIVTTGVATLDAGSGAINLTESTNQLSRISVSGANATLINGQRLGIASSNLTGALIATTTTGSIAVDEVRAGQRIELNSADSIVDVNGSAVNLITDTAVLRSVNGVGDNNNAIETQVARLDIHNTQSGNINIVNLGEITLDSIINDAVDTGNFTMETTADIHVGHIQTVKNLSDDFTRGTVDLFTRGGDILGVGPLDRNVADITGSNLRIVGPQGTFGTLQRPIVNDISGRVSIFMRASLGPIYLDPQPVEIDDQSSISFSSAETLSAVNGVQVTEVETLLDISPAIFTDVRHFVVAEYPVKLPRDQLYIDGYDQEEDEDYFKRFNRQVPVEVVE